MKNFICISLLFFNLLAYSQQTTFINYGYQRTNENVKFRCDREKNERITTGNFGITIDYSFQKINVFSVGANYCIGTMKERAKGTSFFQLDILYAGVFNNKEYDNGFKSGINYSFVGGKLIGISSGLNYLYFNRNSLITPEIGINFIGILSLNYGYSFPNSKNNDNNYISSRIGIRLSLNKIYSLVFKMV